MGEEDRVRATADAAVAAPRRRRRWFQFSLRTLMLLVAAWAIFLTWRVYYAQPVTGKISWVNQRARTAWIDLGQADGITPQTRFAVRSVDAAKWLVGRRKGVVEVTKVLSDRLAEVRIVEDSPSDPITPGDRITKIDVLEWLGQWLGVNLSPAGQGQD